MYQQLELWKAYQAKKRAQQQFDKWMTDLIKRNGTTDYVISDTTNQVKPDKDDLLSAALAECFAMGV